MTIKDQLASLDQYGIEVFGDEDKYERWINTPVQALGGLSPFHFMLDPDKIQAIKDTLSRIEHGIIS